MNPRLIVLISVVFLVATLSIDTFGLGKSVRELSKRATTQLHTCIRPRQKVQKSPVVRNVAAGSTVAEDINSHKPSSLPLEI
jgi:hypothetical protein